MKKLWNKYSYVIILILISFGTSFILLSNIKEARQNDYMTITINEGDSLWDISKEFEKEHNLSSSEFITWVEKTNGITGEEIFPGESLIIPVETDKDFTTEIASSIENE